MKIPMSKSYTWKENNGGWDALDGYRAVARIFTSPAKDLGLIYIAYAYSNPEDKVGCASLDEAKIAAINLHEYPAEAECDTREPKTQKINRMDPAWAQFAAAYLTQPWHPDMGWGPGLTPQDCADFADAMLRERDRRDREEQSV